MSAHRLPHRQVPTCRSIATAAALVALLLLAAPGCSNGKKTEEEKTKTGEKPGNDKTPAGQADAKDAQTQVYAALDDALKKLENDQFIEFFELYGPVEAVRNLRRERARLPGGAVDARMNEEFKKSGVKKEMTEMIKKMRKIKPTFVSSNQVAVFKFTTPEQTIKAKNVPLLDAGKAPANVTGYGGDLKAAIRKAVADLEAGNVEAYLRNMLPVIELRLNDVNDLVKRINAAKATEKRGGDDRDIKKAIGKPDDSKKDAADKKTNPLVQRMIADLKALDKLEPKMESDGSVAVFEKPFTGPGVPKKKKGPPPTQTLKFQKDGGNWRLYDNTTAMRKAAQGMSRKIASTSETMYMEKLGTSWRFTDQKPDRDRGHGAKTINKKKTIYEKSDDGRYEKTEDPRVKRKFDEKTKAPEFPEPPPRFPKNGPPGGVVPPKGATPPKKESFIPPDVPRKPADKTEKP